MIMVHKMKSDNSGWVGKRMMSPDGKIGIVVNDNNNVLGGVFRILTVQFKGGATKELTLSNVGENPSESQKWKWEYTAGKKKEWVEWGY